MYHTITPSNSRAIELQVQARNSIAFLTNSLKHNIKTTQQLHPEWAVDVHKKYNSRYIEYTRMGDYVYAWCNTADKFVAAYCTATKTGCVL
jgi:plastocyanin